MLGEGDQGARAAAMKALCGSASHLLWVHVPKSGGTALARVAKMAAADRSKTLAWCYQARGTPDCSVPPAWAKKNFPGKMDFLPQQHPNPDAVQPKQPHSVFGHFTMAAAEKWNLSGTSVYIVMVRNPFDRLFSGYQQNSRAAKMQGETIAFASFVQDCVDNGNRMMLIGPLLEYLGVDDLNDQSGITTETRVQHAKDVIDRDNTIVLVQE